MRLALLADVHGNLAALEAVAEDIRRRSVSRPVKAVVNLGDHVSGPLLPRQTLRFLRSQDWLHLAGNHERQLTTLPVAEQGPSDAYAHGQLSSDDLAWLGTLEHSRAYGDDVWLCHGTPHSDTTYCLETVEVDGSVRPATENEVTERLGGVTSALIACGHTHVPRAVRLSNQQLVVNPGSVGLPAYDDAQPYPHKMASGSPAARYAVVERHAGRWSAELISVDYDHETMARLATRRGREDWAEALRTGALG